MFRVRVSFHTLGNRLDSEHYDPEALALEALLRSRPGLQRIGDIVNPRRHITNGVRGPALEDSPYKLVRLQDCKEWEIDTSRCLTISQYQFDDNRRCRLFPGDVVVAIGGYLGNAAVVSTAVPAVIGQHSALLPFGHSTTNDPRYLVAFLNSRMGEIQFRRWSRGSIQTGLNLEDIGDIEILCPDGAAQSYIGSKVRQAEALRTWARNSLSVANAYHKSLYSPLIGDTKWRPFKLSAQELCDLLASEAYPPDVAEYFRSNSSISLGEACYIYSGTTKLNAENAQGGVEQATSRSCTGQFIRRPCNRVVPPRTNDKYLRRGDIIVTNAAHDKSYIGKDYTLYHDDRPNFPSTKVLVLRPSREHVPASYLHHVLKSPLGYRQTQAVIRGISAGIAPDDMERIRIPLPTLASDERDRWFAMDEDVYQAGFTLEVASCLTNSSRFLVEALIEGKVTEAELIEAGKDADADRALLARLRDDGLDGAGSPLFSDIDAMFELIEQVKRGEADS
jgi:type I restriction enzyme S subunit